MRYLILAVTLFLPYFGGGCAPRAEQPVTPRAEVSRTSSPEGAELPPSGRSVVAGAPRMPRTQHVPAPAGVQVSDFATALEVPWDLAFLPKGRVLITERPGRVRVMRQGRLEPHPYATVAVRRGGEAGLMGMAVAPDFARAPYVYLMYTAAGAGGPVNRVSRWRDAGTSLVDEEVLIDDIPAHQYHDGGALRFGLDGMLYIGTGDAGQPEEAQNRNSLLGKILRITPDGKVPPDNPTPGSPVWALGFRNVQGLAWNPANGELWATNHGPSGDLGLRQRDSVFVVPKGGNCGWPRVLGAANVRGVAPPRAALPG